MKNNKLLTVSVVLLAGVALTLPLAKGVDKLVINEEAKEDVGPAPKFEDDKVAFYNQPDVVRAAEDEIVCPTKVILHYHNDDNKCLDRRFYTWVDGVEGVERIPDHANGTDMDITLDFTEITEYADHPLMKFIIKMAGTWSGQSEDTVLSFADFPPDASGTLEVWTIPGEGSSIEIYKTEDETKQSKISYAKFTDWKTISCRTYSKEGTEKPLEYKLYAFDKTFLELDDDQQIARKEYYLFKQGIPSAVNFEIKFNYTARLNVQYVIESTYSSHTKTQKIVVGSENLYKSARFEQYYTYDGDDLGMTYKSDRVTFKVWSPVAALMKLNVYRNGTPKIYGGSDARRQYNMSYTKGGVWQIDMMNSDGSMDDKYYTFSVTNSNGTIETIDPYVKATGLNGLRGYVYNKEAAEANPTDWDSVPSVWDGTPGYDIATPQDLSIYEVHIRDLTMDDTWQSNHDNPRGTYNAFVESGTTYTDGVKTVTTGFDHIKELGVRAVQLLPVFDQDNDERPDKLKFNWGYNPLNYNVVEGGYSTDPSNPLTRIVEYKNLIKAFADPEGTDHTRVIMDVVYNHVSSAASSSFNKIVPKYYFRYTSNWEYYDGSGCNNEVASDVTMMSKFIVDSLLWWAKEYKIKGFRFDLMGLLDTWTLRSVAEKLYEYDKDIYIYGEGWTSGGYHGKAEVCLKVDEYGNPKENGNPDGNYFIVDNIVTEDPVHPGHWYNDGRWYHCREGGADSAHAYSALYEYIEGGKKGKVGAFNDDGRNALKGSNDGGYGSGNPYAGFGLMTQDKGHVGSNAKTVAKMLMGRRDVGTNPQQTINYASCHDNYTLYDQLRYCMAGSYGEGFGQDEPLTNYASHPYRHIPYTAPSVYDVIDASISVHAAIMFSNGVAFMQGGEELYRTKKYSTTELVDLMKGGDEAIVRPYPTFPSWDESPKDANGNPTETLCTGEVIMYDGEIITHNSYKSSDNVNSFKWDRKISVDGNDVTGYNQIWQQIIQTRNDIAKHGYVEGFDSSFNIYGVSDLDNWSAYQVTGLAVWNGGPNSTGYTLFLCGGEGYDIGVGSDTFFTGNTIVCSVGYHTNEDNKVKLGWHSFVLTHKS